MQELKPEAGVLRSEDGGATWAVHGKLGHYRSWLIENTVAERRDGSLVMFFRTRLNVLFQSLSFDRGKSWSKPRSTGIPNPDSKIQLLRLDQGHLALVFNSHRRFDIDDGIL